MIRACAECPLDEKHPCHDGVLTYLFDETGTTLTDTIQPHEFVRVI